MKVGAIIPQGWTGEYDGWDARSAWDRTLSVAQRAEALGFDSLWAFDHFHTTPDPTDELTFESFTTLTAAAGVTEHVSLGHIVMCAAYRNPALAAKMLSTLDLVSGGRVVAGVGAGWKQEEFDAYGYTFPPLRERQARLKDTLEIFRAMFGAGHATYQGETASVRDAINIPKPIQQPSIPIMVGGNGPKVTWGLAARYADEVNLDSLAPGKLPEALATIRQRCEEIDRDPGTLRVSVHLWLKDRAWLMDTGEQDLPIPDLLAAYVEHGVYRVMGLIPGSESSDEALEEFADQARQAGAELQTMLV